MHTVAGVEEEEEEAEEEVDVEEEDQDQEHLRSDPMPASSS